MPEKLDPFRGYGEMSNPIKTVKDLRDLLASYNDNIPIWFQYTDDFGQHPEQHQFPKLLVVVGRYDPGAGKGVKPSFLIVGKPEQE